MYVLLFYFTMMLHWFIQNMQLPVVITLTCRCRTLFDYSDHIVLFYAHYLVPCAMEFTVVLTKALMQKGSLSQSMCKFAVPLLSIVALVVLSMRGFLFTTMYFHTHLENIVAYLIAVVFVGLPVCLVANTRLWWWSVLGYSSNSTAG